MDSMFSVKDKVVVITGSAQGMGKRYKETFESLGSRVYGMDISYRSDTCGNEIYCDVTDHMSVSEAFAEVFRRARRIDVLVNNAGVTFPREEPYPASLWDKTIAVNLTGVFNCTSVCAGYMKLQESGSIINITSINAERGFPNNPAYVASKTGVMGITRSFAKDFGKYGVRVNNIGPGYIQTEMTKRSWDDPAKRQRRTDMTMLGRWGTVDDIQGACVFLASDASSYITGQTIYVDGGWLANGMPSGE